MNPTGFGVGSLLCFSLLLGPIGTSAQAQIVDTRPNSGSDGGRELYMRACANCHGPDGTGVAAEVLGFDDPAPADFTDCTFAAREPDGDWGGVALNGGPSRVFSPMMPAFGDALSREEIDLILGYVRGFCTDDSWPRGELNLPLALVTEKAFPEDEAVVKASVGDGEVSNKLVYEKRFGPLTQIEVVVPFGWKESVTDDLSNPDDGGWKGGIGDVAVGIKRVLFHSLSSGTIFSFTGEAILPTGDPDFGKGYTVLEPFLTLGQFLPHDAFVQLQTGLEIPTSSDGENEGFWRVALGRTFTSGGEWGRAWSPMVEVLGARAFEDEATTRWDLVPQVQVALNTRQHILANFGVRFPVNDTDTRDPQLLFYVLWDWFDGGFFEGW